MVLVSVQFKQVQSIEYMRIDTINRDFHKILKFLKFSDISNLQVSIIAQNIYDIQIYLPILFN